MTHINSADMDMKLYPDWLYLKQYSHKRVVRTPTLLSTYSLGGVINLSDKLNLPFVTCYVYIVL